MKKLVILMIVATVAVAASAEVININFYASNGGAAGVSEDPATLEGPVGGLGQTWNQFNTKDGSNLLDSTGAVTTVGFSNNVGSGWGAGNPDLRMLYASRAIFGKGADTTMTISGLEAGSLYNIWITSYNQNTLLNEHPLGEWSTSNPSANGPQMIDTRTSGLNHSTWEYGVNYVLLEAVTADVNGEIAILGDAADGTVDVPEYGETYPTRLHLNGMQIETVNKPSSPTPGNEEEAVAANPLTLSWVNADPNTTDDPSNVAYVDVWFGTDPGTWTKVVDGQAVETVGVDASIEGTYYWRVDSYLNGDPGVVDYTLPVDPNVIEGVMWMFNTVAVIDYPVSNVDAGPNIETWANQPTQLYGYYEDDGVSAVTVTWTASDPNAVFSPSNDGGVTSNDLNPTVTVDYAARNVTMTLTVEDAEGAVSDTTNVDVWGDACAMTRNNDGVTISGDIDRDCDVDLVDLAILAKDWLLDYEFTAPLEL